MAPSRDKSKVQATASRNAGAPSVKRAVRSTRNTNDGVPDVFQDLLAEAAGNDSSTVESNRPLKKRKVIPSSSTSHQQLIGSDGDEQSATDVSRSRHGRKRSIAKATARAVQTVEDSSQSEYEDESDFAFEDVDLELPSDAGPAPPADGIEDVNVSVYPSTESKRRITPKRKPASLAERAFRLQVHKLHVLCLLGHCMYINSWCNNAAVQQHLYSQLSKKTLSYLNPKRTDSQFQRNRSFMDGLQQAADAFRGIFDVTASGMRRAKWAADGEESAVKADPDPLDLSEFITAAKNLEGSQDTANQLFCALLRSAGVDTRLVCSLQTLPFRSVSIKSGTPSKPAKPVIYLPAIGSISNHSNTEDAAVKDSSSIGNVPSVRRRLGQPSFAHESAPARTAERKKKPVRKLAHPVFWVEAFNAAQQKWIAVDPIVTESVSKPSRFEPPSSYAMNQMAYVIAFEDDGVARDVTRRYSKSYNAKVRRQRVESTDDGSRWFKKAMRVFRRRGGALDREQVEDAELAQKEAREGLPANVQDFKDHPYYALERHSKRNEIIDPKREVGKVNAGTAAKPRMESVYRRQDVLVCRTADKWYRLGREIQRGQQPVKLVPTRSRRPKSPLIDDDNGEETNITGLYAAYQTEAYIPPPVVKGRIPKNAYDNLDIYVPSMVPAGGTHIQHELAQTAARTLRIDYADAVTGFQFKGRHGTAIKEGVIVATPYADAVNAVIDGLQDDQAHEDAMARSALALKLWKRFVIGLRIAERVSGYGDKDAMDDIKHQMDEAEEAEEEATDAGGFFPGDVEEPALPTAGRFSLEQLSIKTATPKQSKRKPRLRDESADEAELTSEGESFVSETPAARPKRNNRRVVDEDSEDEYVPDQFTPVAEDVRDMADDELDFGDGGGGGFFQEHTVMEGIEPGGGNDSSTANGLFGEDEELGGGFLPEQFDDEAPQLDPDAEHHSQTQSPTIDIFEDLNTQEIGHSTHRLEEVQPKQPFEAVEVSNPADQDDAKAADDAASDIGSMLSHDPEDEDAEPDWLESD